MKTILLLLENTIEFDFAKTILVKTGFNVLSRQYDISTKLQYTFPDVVITSSLAQQHKSLQDLVNLKANKGVPKFIWVGAQERYKKLDQATKSIVDSVIDSPIQPEKLLESICLMTGLDAIETVQKYRSLYSKSMDKANATKPISIERERRYQEILEKVESKDMVFATKEIKRRSDPDAGQKNTPELLEQKKEFLRTLFKK